MNFKTMSLAAIALTLGTTVAFAQPATVSSSGNVCLKTILIDHTETPDTKTILFFMKNGTAWKNTLKSDCIGLRQNGFIYMPTPPDQVCGNFQTIRTIETRSVCVLGPFTPYEKKKPSVEHSGDPHE
ncbi:MAG TPA: hypothetical protein VG891_09485 [Rhizomicrobium sp.]|nr:hypothetical protein [Rhizomicrobium sp.]